MSDASTINVLCELNWRLIDNSKSVIVDSWVMLQLVASFMMSHIFVVKATGPNFLHILQLQSINGRNKLEYFSVVSLV